MEGGQLRQTNVPEQDQASFSSRGYLTTLGDFGVWGKQFSHGTPEEV
jgi:hypothetical protein